MTITPSVTTLDSLILPTLVLLAQSASAGSPSLPLKDLFAALRDHPGADIPSGMLERLVADTGPLRCREGDLATRGIPFPLVLPTVNPVHGQGLRITSAGRRHLAARVINLYTAAIPDVTAPVKPTAPSGHRVGERDAMPMVLLAAAQIQREQNGLPAAMTQVRERAKRMLALSQDDLQPLKDRPDTRIDQVIRNLISNSHFGDGERAFFDHTPEGLSLTEDGAEELLSLTLSALPAPDFHQLMHRARAQHKPAAAPPPTRTTRH